MSEGMRSLACLVLASALVAAPAGAAPSDHATAQRHFDEGRRLVEGGKCDLAVREFRSSLEAEPSVGAWLNLGECQERLGQLQDAYESYRSAQGLAAQLRNSRLGYARESAERILAKTVRVSVQAPPNEEVQVEVDGVEIPRERWPTILVTPDASHRLVVRGGGGLSRELRGHAGETLPMITVAPSAAAPPTTATTEQAPQRAPEQPPPKRVSNTQQTIGFVVGGVGLGALAVGGVFGLLALSAKNDLAEAVDARKDCPGGYPSGTCDPDARAQLQPLEDEAQRQATVANILYIGGGIALAAGVTLVLLAPSQPSRTTARFTGILRTALFGGRW